MSRGFIADMADHYNLSEHEIESFYFRYCLTGEFYEKLEEYVKARRTS